MTRKVIKRTPKVEHKVVVEDLAPLMQELQHIKDKQKALETRADQIKAVLKQYVEQIGLKDTRGSYLVRVGDKVAKNEARKKVKLDETKAEELFRSLGIWEEIIDVKEIINPSYIEQAFLNKKITQAQLESVTKTDINYAFVVYDYKPEEDTEGLL